MYINIAISSSFLMNNFDSHSLYSEESKTLRVPYSTTHSNGNKIYYALIHEQTNKDEITRLIGNKYGCNTCEQRAHILSTLSCQDGQVFLRGEQKHEIYTKVSLLVNEGLGNVIGIKLINDSNMGIPMTTVGHYRDYHHHTTFFGDSHCSLVYKNAAKVVHKYLGLVTTLFHKTMDSDFQDKLEQAKLCMGNIINGEQFLFSIKVIQDAYLEHPDWVELKQNQQSRVVIDTILKYYSSKHNVIGWFHQMNGNLLSAIQASNGDRAELEEVLKHRLSPLNYQRTTKELSQGNIKCAVSGLGDFKLSLITTDQMVTKGAIPIGQNDSSLNAFANMSMSQTSSKFPPKLSWEQLLENIQSVFSLEVYTTSDDQACHISDTTMDKKEFLISENLELQAFSTNKGCSRWGLEEMSWNQVTHLWDVNGFLDSNNSDGFMFLALKGALPSPPMRVPCFKSDLNLKYRSTCGRGYEALQTSTMKLIIPDSNNGYALGVGSCKTSNGENGSCNVFRVRINNKHNCVISTIWKPKKMGLSKSAPK